MDWPCCDESDARPGSGDRSGEAGLRAPTAAICGGGADLDRFGLFPLLLNFSSSVFLPSFQKDLFDGFPLPPNASTAASRLSMGSRSLDDDLEDSVVGGGKDPGSSGAIDPLDSVSLGRAATSL